MFVIIHVVLDIIKMKCSVLLFCKNNKDQEFVRVVIQAAKSAQKETKPIAALPVIIIIILCL